MKTVAMSEPTFKKLLEIKKILKKEKKCNVTYAQIIEMLVDEFNSK